MNAAELWQLARSDQVKAFENGSVPWAAPSLDDILITLSAFGKPSLWRMSGGWCCSCEMHVSRNWPDSSMSRPTASDKGASFQVRSEFDCPTPMSAARQCGERVISALTKES